MCQEVYINTVVFVRDDSATGGPSAGQTRGMQRAKTQWVGKSGAPVTSLDVAFGGVIEMGLRGRYFWMYATDLFFAVAVSQSRETPIQSMMGVFCVEALPVEALPTSASV